MHVSNKDKRFFDLALKTARLSKCNFRHGAVITTGGTPVSLGINILKYRNLSSITIHGSYCEEAELRRKWQETSHAEACAILDAECNIKRGCIYSARLKKDGTPGLSKPCASCRQIIELAGITTVVYWGVDPGKTLNDQSPSIKKVRIEELYA